MKKLIYTFIVLLGFATTSLAQDNTNVAVTQGKTELAASKVSGKYIFVLPSQMNQEKVDHAASYYKDFFTVGFNNDTKEATIKLNDNTEQARYVIARFLAMCEVQSVKVDETEMKVYDFIEAHLK